VALLVRLHKHSIPAILEATIAAKLSTATLGMKSDAIRQLFCERYLAGVPYGEIAKELGVSLRTLGYWANEMGLTRRKGGPRLDRWMPDEKLKKSPDFSIP